MRDAVKCPVTFAFDWNGSPGAPGLEPALLVLYLTAESQSMSFKKTGSFIMFSCYLRFHHFISCQKEPKDLDLFLIKVI